MSRRAKKASTAKKASKETKASGEVVSMEIDAVGSSLSHSTRVVDILVHLEYS